LAYILAIIQHYTLAQPTISHFRWQSEIWCRIQTYRIRCL